MAQAQTSRTMAGSGAGTALQQVAQFEVPQPDGRTEAWRVVHAPLPSLVREPTWVPKFVVPNPLDPGALVVYGRLHQKLGDSRTAVLLQPGPEGFTSLTVAERNILGAAIRPNRDHPVLAIWTNLHLALQSFDGKNQLFGGVGCEGITTACFHPHGGFIVARTRQSGIHPFRLVDKDNELTIEALPRGDNRQTGPSGAMAYDACGTLLYGVEGGQCTIADVTKRPVMAQSLGVIPEEQRPLVIACQPDKAAPPQAAFGGKGSFVHFMGGRCAPWTRVRVAPDGQEFGATGLAWLDPHHLLGWLHGKLFAFSTPPAPLAADPPIRRPRPSYFGDYRSSAKRTASLPPAPDQPALWGTWTPPDQTKIMSVQVLGAARHIIVFTAAVPEDELVKLETT